MASGGGWWVVDSGAGGGIVVVGRGGRGGRWCGAWVWHCTPLLCEDISWDTIDWDTFDWDSIDWDNLDWDAVPCEWKTWVWQEMRTVEGEEEPPTHISEQEDQEMATKARKLSKSSKEALVKDGGLKKRAKKPKRSHTQPKKETKATPRVKRTAPKDETPAKVEGVRKWPTKAGKRCIDTRKKAKATSVQSSSIYQAVVEQMPKKACPVGPITGHSYVVTFGKARIQVLLRQRAFFLLQREDGEKTRAGEKRHYGFGPRVKASVVEAWEAVCEAAAAA